MFSVGDCFLNQVQASLSYSIPSLFTTRNRRGGCVGDCGLSSKRWRSRLTCTAQPHQSLKANCPDFQSLCTLRASKVKLNRRNFLQTSGNSRSRIPATTSRPPGRTRLRIFSACAKADPKSDWRKPNRIAGARATASDANRRAANRDGAGHGSS